MALWREITSRPDLETQMTEYYNKMYLSQIRADFSRWIETKIMPDRSNMNNNVGGICEQNAIAFCEELNNKLVNCFSNQYSYQIYNINNITPIALYEYLQYGIAMEHSLLKNVTNKIKDRLKVMENDTNDLNQSIPIFINNSQQFQILFNNLNIQPLQQSNTPVMNEVEANYRCLCQTQLAIISKLNGIIREYDSVQKCVIDQELKIWQKNQALFVNGDHFNDNLDEIQLCIEKLIVIICSVIGCIKKLMSSNTLKDNEITLNENLQYTLKAQERLICSACIIEKQPPQVMKTNSKFSVTVRWLIGEKLGINICPTVKCFILSESQAQQYCSQQLMADAPRTTSGDILNNSCSMEYQQQTKHFSANFRNLQLKKIIRAERRGTECVMEEKIALLFHISVNRIVDYRIRVWTLSLPVVVIVHGTQEPQAWATITWDNAFASIVREPFHVPDKVSWRQLSEVIYSKFNSTTERPLNEENMQFLYEKLFRKESMCDYDDNITWAQFCKEPMPDRAFTFWEWFFAIMKLTKDHLLGPWKAGLITGFINKTKTSEVVLRQFPLGTFLLRFSDSELGGITVAFVGEEGVLFLQPWNAKDLNVRGLADRIQDLQLLRYMYPNIPKDSAFSNFYTPVPPSEQSADGYVRNIIRAHIPGIEAPSANTTPNRMVQSPQFSDLGAMNNISDSMFTDEIDFGEILFDNEPGHHDRNHAQSQVTQ